MVKYKECRVVKPKTEALGFRIGVILRDKKYEKAWSLNPIWGGGSSSYFFINKKFFTIGFPSALHIFSFPEKSTDKFLS